VQEISEILNQFEQQLPGLPQEPGDPQHPPGACIEDPEEDIVKLETDISL
jgi:hypothetical protein